MNKKTDNKRREMSKNRKNVNVKKGAEFVEGAIDELVDSGWNLFSIT